MIRALKLVAVVAGIAMAFGLGTLMADGGRTAPVEEPETSETQLWEDTVDAEMYTILPNYVFPGNLNNLTDAKDLIDYFIAEMEWRDEQILLHSEEIDQLREQLKYEQRK